MQDDAHIFCLSDQIKDEIRGVLDLTEEMLLQFGFSKYEVNLSTRPEKSVGDDDIWEKATSALKDALDDKGWSYQIDDGGGAFYGPKIDLKIEDALGRKWQCSTIQAIPLLVFTFLCYLLLLFLFLISSMTSSSSTNYKPIISKSFILLGFRVCAKVFYACQ